MKIEQPHASIKVKTNFIENQEQELKNIINDLSNTKHDIESYLHQHDIYDLNILEKLNKLELKIQELTNLLDSITRKIYES